MKILIPIQKIPHLIIFTFISFIASSCGSPKTVAEESAGNMNVIINEEIRRFDNKQPIHVESVFYNHHLKGLLNGYLKGDRIAKDQLENTLTPSEITLILNAEEIEHLLRQLDQPGKIPYTPFMANKKVVLEDLSGETSDNTGDRRRIRNMDKDRMLISTPVFTRNNEFAIVDVSKGRLNSMYTSINLYKRGENGFEFYKTLFGFME